MSVKVDKQKSFFPFCLHLNAIAYLYLRIRLSINLRGFARLLNFLASKIVVAK